jgi:hypothetical protein
MLSSHSIFYSQQRKRAPPVLKGVRGGGDSPACEIDARRGAVVLDGAVEELAHLAEGAVEEVGGEGPGARRGRGLLPHVSRRRRVWLCSRWRGGVHARAPAAGGLLRARWRGVGGARSASARRAWSATA